MVSNEEIKRRLELKRKGLDPDKKTSSEVPRTPVKSGISSKKKISCPKCGTMNLESSKFCISCGNELQKEKKVVIKETKPKTPKTIICPECQTKNTETSRFCIGCGKNLKDIPNEGVKEDTSKQVSAPEEKAPLLEVAEEDKIEENRDLLEAEDKSDSSPKMEEDITQAEKTDFFEEIKKAKELLDIGAISEEEFERIKNSYLKKFE